MQFDQLRSDITHRGKAVYQDYERLRGALAQLLSIFRHVIRVARSDASSAQQVAGISCCDAKNDQ